ncbi:unnamed protein product, partial [Iphiclides podalirius]
MSGKAYTMKEMKAIVDYLTQRRAYGEIKGRKMWMDFEKSKFTDRTWQSLKETFLKRILPDIHNPYYQLTLTQISSFRQGYDVEAKLNNKLEIRTVSDGSSTDAVQLENTEQPSTSNNKDGEEKSGEENINSQTVSHHRSSAETIILEPCYETAEEIQKDLESPKQDDEPQMEIAEDIEMEKEKNKLYDHKLEDPLEISSETDDLSNNADMDKPSDNEQNIDGINKIEKSLKDVEKSIDNMEKSTHENSAQNVTECSKVIDSAANNAEKTPLPDNETENALKIYTQKNDKEIDPNNVEKVSFSQNTCTQNFSNATTDTLIPNNQEELSTKSEPVNKNTSEELHSQNMGENAKKHRRKRAISQEPTFSKQKRRSLVLNSKPMSVSDTDAGKKQADEIKKNIELSVTSAHIEQCRNLQTSGTRNKTENVKKQIPKEIEAITEDVNEENINKGITESTKNHGKNEETLVDSQNNLESDVDNPCLKSVSLYDEQFTSNKYSESSDDVVTKKTCARKECSAPKNKDLREIEAVSTKLRSDYEKDDPEKKKKATPMVHALNSERKRALSNVFGFSSGAVPSGRKRRVSYQNRTRRQSHNKASSGSSEWTSESDIEFVSPPRGRRNRQAKKYLKPRPARILSLEEEGGLFVMYGKKIYPVVKDGKIMKNYVTYAPERDSEDEDESFWKLKYIEEKKRTAQLTKLLNQTNDDAQKSNEKALSHNQNPSPKKRKLLEDETETEKTKTVQVNVPKEAGEDPKRACIEEKTLKIKITKQDEEVQLEGHWSQIHPVFDRVVQIFHKEPKAHEAKANEPKADGPKAQESKAHALPDPAIEQCKTVSSGISTPLIAVPDDEVHEKVNKLETEIFQKIKALDSEELSPSPQLPAPPEPQIIKRGPGRPKKHSITPNIAAPENPGRKSKNADPEKLLVEENAVKVSPAEVENVKSPVTRQKRTPKKVLHESTERNDSNVINTRTRRSKDLQPEEVVNEETEVRYKFPSPSPPAKKSYRKSGANKITKQQKTNKRYIKKSPAIFASPDNVSIDSIESSQGYQDSDISPTLCLRKKKKLTATFHGRGKYHSRFNTRRRTHWQLDDMFDQSSNSCPDFGQKSTFSHKSSSSEAYRSDSYQLLMPKIRNTFDRLAKIDEVNSNEQGASEVALRDNNVGAHEGDRPNKDKSPLVGDVTDVDNSSNVTFPPSPVLSIVENITISNSALNSINDNVDEENAHNDTNGACNSGDFKITDVDVSMPLMQQDCGLQTNAQNVAPQSDAANSLPAVITESFINKICTVNIEDNPTLSETINQKLRNLLLESAKKIERKSLIAETASDKMEIDTTQTEASNQTRSKKRCSTPLKRSRTTKNKSKKPGTAPSIEEEHTECCSHSGRKSCPPLIQNPGDVANSVARSETTTDSTKEKQRKGRKRNENVIKVKILRPRARTSSKETNIENTNRKAVESVHGDSGINDTITSVLSQGHDSVDLIHNHSETCLQANDCVGDSVEFIENGTKSVISLDSSSDQSETGRAFRINCDSGQHTQLEILDCNAFGRMRFNNAEDGEVGTYHTPMNSELSPTSLMTEDLSDPEMGDADVRASHPSKWYLLSEDETTNTNLAVHTNSNVGYGSDLNRLFPIACAVPDLSTITEMSNDKASVAGRGTQSGSFSQFVFDTNFDSNF